MTESEMPDDGMPTEVLMYAAEEAILHGKPQILKSYGLVVVPDLTALRAIAAGKEMPDTFRLHTSEGRRSWSTAGPGWSPSTESLATTETQHTGSVVFVVAS